MNLKLTKTTIGLIILLIFSILLWEYFLKASGFELLEIIKTTSLKSTISLLTSTNFIAFLLLFPLTFAIIFALTKFLEKKELRIIALIGGIIGLLLGMVLFFGQSMIIIGVFYILGLLLSIEMAYARLEELKKWIMPRMIADSSQKAFFLLGIGIFIFTAITVLPQQEQYLNSMEKSVIDAISNDSFGSGLNDSLTQVFISTQKQTLTQITDTPYYSDLKTVQDSKAAAYVVFVETIQANIDSPEYKREVKTQIQSNQTSLSQGKNVELVFEKIKKSLPLYSLIEKYFWLISAFIIVSFYFLFANFIIKPLTIIYGTIIHKILTFTLKK
ncbi:MAG: hypothetical protein Q7S21_03725 [archaeon]|nr:hypothetical protein [archaeon]